MTRAQVPARLDGRKRETADDIWKRRNGDWRSRRERRSRSVRFRDTEWKRIEAFAKARGLTGSEFVRCAALAAAADRGEATARLAPLIETTFRATHILATKMRVDMLDAGRRAEIEELVQAARALQDELLQKRSG